MKAAVEFIGCVDRMSKGASSKLACWLGPISERCRKIEVNEDLTWVLHFRARPEELYVYDEGAVNTCRGKPSQPHIAAETLDDGYIH